MGKIFDIQRISVHDGPGIRTTVFLKGCPLRCKWCHNPEGLNGRIQLKYLDEKCILCQWCKMVCGNKVHTFGENTHLIDFSACIACGKCVAECPSTALELVGEEISPSKLVSQVCEDKVFFGQEGGLTLSGGEPMLQPEFVYEIFCEAKKAGLHTCLDTSGYAKWEKYERVLPVTDCFLYDVKAYSADIHRKATGVDNQIIKGNLRKLCRYEKPVYIRTPVVNGYNATLDEMQKIADFLKGLPIVGITLMPYHTLGQSKYCMLGIKKYEGILTAPAEEEMEQYKKLFTERGIQVI